MNIVYIRASSDRQNLARQEHLRDGADKVFEEKASAKSTDRPRLQEMLDFAREGDHITVDSIDRLARSLPDLFAIIARLKEKNVSIHFKKENLRFDPTEAADPFQNLQFTIVGAFAQFEREISRVRQREGIAKARAAGKYKGRKRRLTDEQVEAAYKQHATYRTPQAAIARDLKVSPSTLNKEFKALEARREKAA